MKISMYKTTLLSAAVTSLLLASCGTEKADKSEKKEKPIPVTLATAKSQPGGQILVSGRIEAKETAVISTRVMGFVTGVKVNTGDVVKKGQLLMTISNGDIIARRAQAQAMVAETEAALKDAQKDYERFTELFNQKSASEKELENITLHYNSMKSKAEAAKQMQHEAEVMLTYTNLVAPFSGVITSKTISEGSMANPGMPLLTLEQTDGFQVIASVDETEIPFIKTGTEAIITIKSNGKTFSSVIREVSPSSHYSGGQYSIKVLVPENAKAGLFPGMYVQVSITTATHKEEEQSVLIPSGALVWNDQLAGLYTIGANNTALLRLVRPGKKSGDHVEILSGLNADEKFILTSEGRLYNGAPVAIR